MSAGIKPWLLLGGIFIVGIVTGGALAIGFAPWLIHPHEGDMKVHWMAMLTRRLNLTPDERDKIQPIVYDASARVQNLHHDEMEHGSEIMKAANEQILALLTPDQQILLQKMEAEREKMFSNRMHGWGPPPGGPFHDGPDMPDHSGPPDRMTPPSFNEKPVNVAPPPMESPTNAAPQKP